MSARDFGLMVVVCLTWALNNILSKYVVSDLAIPPLFYAAARFAVLTAATIPFLFPMPRPAWRLILVALLMGGGNFAIFFVGLKYSTPSSAAVVLQLGLPMTLIMSVLILKERIGPRRALGMALTFAGALTVMWDPRGFTISAGLMLVALAALMGSLGAVLLKQLEGVKPLTYQAWVGFISLWPLALLSLLLEPGQVQAGIDAGWRLWAAVLFSALVVSLAAHSGYYILMQRYEANLISALTLMTPLSTIAMGVALLGDPFGPRMAIGTVLALSGVLIIIVRTNRAWTLLMGLGNRNP